MVKDLKGYRENGDGKAKSPGWFILVISHLAIFVVGLSLGHWMGERFATVSSPQKTVSREVPFEKDKTHASRARGEKQVPPKASGKDETARSSLGPPDRPEKEPRFTFYDSLQKEYVPATEPSTEAEETKKVEASKGTSPTTPGIRKGPRESTLGSSSLVYYVQVASFREEERARRLASHLMERGYSAGVSKAVLDSGIWHRVRVGPFENQRAANEKAAAIKKSEKLRPFILSEKLERRP